MKYTIHIIVIEAICPNTQNVFYHSLHVPIWNIHHELIDAERNYIKNNTLSMFVKNFSYDLLEEREEKNLAIDLPRKLDNVLHTIFDPALPSQTLDQHRLHLTIDIDYCLSKKHQRCHFFERFTPLFVCICSSIDFLLIGILGFSAMQYAQSDSGFLNMDYDTNFGISLGSSLMGILWTLWEFFSGGEIVFLKDTGAMLDKQCHQLLDRYNGVEHGQELVAGTSFRGMLLKRLSKTLFALAFLNDIYQQITSSYTTIVSLSNTINESIALPANVFRLLQLCELSFSHIDDPFMWATVIYFGFSVIDVLINTHFPAAPVEELCVTTPIISVEQDEKKISGPASPADEKRISRLSRWTQVPSTRPDQYCYHPLAAAPKSDPDRLLISASAPDSAEQARVSTPTFSERSPI